MRILRNFVQGSNDWFQEHLSRCSASNAAKIQDFTKAGKEGSTRRLYRLEKVMEALTINPVNDHFVSAPMQAGTAAEPLARRAYALEEGVFVEQVGIVIGDDERTCYSPDGLVGKHGAIEAKGAKTTTHLQWMDAGVVPEQHIPQMVFGMMVDEDLDWMDFVSRDGGMTEDRKVIADAIENGTDLSMLPERYRQFTIRLDRAEVESKIATMREDAAKFLADLDATIERLKQRAPEVAEPERIAEDFGDLGLSDADIQAADPNWKG